MRWQLVTRDIFSNPTKNSAREWDYPEADFFW
jgi:hypothetical protein